MTRWISLSAVLAALGGCVFLTETDRQDHTDNDGDGVSATNDCDEDDASVFPGQVETCNGKDDDCNGTVDDGLLPDDDGDLYGDDNRAGESCFVDWILEGGDCDDTDAQTYPAAMERCDGLNNGCIDDWTALSELGVVTWQESEGDTGAIDLSADFDPSDSSETVTLPDAGTVTICRGATDYEVRMVQAQPGVLSVVGVAIPIDGDEDDDDARPVFNCAASDGPVLALDGSDWEVQVSGITLTAGEATPSQSGGGIHATGGTSLVLEDVYVRSNHAPDGTVGGGIYVENIESVELRDSIVDLNWEDSDAGPGGAGIAIVDCANVGIYDSRLASNSASDYGGGLWVEGTSEVELARVTIESNIGKRGGGGIYLASGVIRMVDVLITGNSASNIDEQGGGGLYVGGTLECSSTDWTSSIEGNSAGGTGGGARVDGDGTLRVEGCNFSGNKPDAVYAAGSWEPSDDSFYCDADGCEDLE